MEWLSPMNVKNSISSHAVLDSNRPQIESTGSGRAPPRVYRPHLWWSRVNDDAPAAWLMSVLVSLLAMSLCIAATMVEITQAMWCFLLFTSFMLDWYWSYFKMRDDGASGNLLAHVCRIYLWRYLAFWLSSDQSNFGVVRRKPKSQIAIAKIVTTISLN